VLSSNLNLLAAYLQSMCITFISRGSSLLDFEASSSLHTRLEHQHASCSDSDPLLPYTGTGGYMYSITITPRHFPSYS
jgi:hypothetical protein